jgi:DNA-binding XRE family transcriptional regulator
MSRRKNPAGYPGDEAVRRSFDFMVDLLCHEKGLTRDELERRMRRQQFDRRWSRRALGLRIRAIRAARGLTRAELADQAGVPLRVLTIAERGGDSAIGLGEVIRLSLALKYNVVNLVGEVDALRKRLEAENSDGKAERA